MEMTNFVILIILITVLTVIFMYYYRNEVVESVLKGRIKLIELRGKKDFSRMTELFIFGLVALIGWFLFGKSI